jgi:glycosyltransferase involved in cell wall biosynthesis
MEFIQNYLIRNQVEFLIPGLPSNNLGMVIVIPCFNEPNLEATLHSLWICDKPDCHVEIIIVINDSEDSSSAIKEQNQLTVIETRNWIEKHKLDTLHFHLLYCCDLPPKHAGVGLARKIGMDQAISRFNAMNNSKGIIINLDADSICDTNYLTAIENHFNKNIKTPGASIYFEHPIPNPTPEATIKSGILQYELHLRYLNQALRFIGHPHAFHTVGSCFAVRADAYVRQGGMNKRKAGEDFHFIQKIIWLGNFTEINTTKVIPSDRISDRVPFGTGAAMKKLSDDATDELLTYNFQSFVVLKQFFLSIEAMYQSDSNNLPKIISPLADPVKKFLLEINFEKEIRSIQNNTASYSSFKNRFFLWFDVFRVIKFINQSHNQCYTKQPVAEECKKLLAAYPIHTSQNPAHVVELLTIFRLLDRKGTEAFQKHDL